MLSRRRTTLHPIKTLTKHEKKDAKQRNKMELDKPTASRQNSRREKKLALQRDVDKLKKKLRHEENIHRALERAFRRPLGTLPRLPPDLPFYILELLAEVAVLEEEVLKLEEQLVLFRKGLYQEAVCISSSNRNVDSSVDLYDPYPSTRRDETKNTSRKERRSVSCDAKCHIGNEKGKESSLRNSLINKQQSAMVQPIQTSLKKPSFENKQTNKQFDHQLLQRERRANHQEFAEVTTLPPDDRILGDNCPNAISENIIKCLITILLRMKRTRSKSISEERCPLLSSVGNSDKLWVQDPYGICSELRRDVGPYKNLGQIDFSLINPIRMTSSVALPDRLKVLVGKLASVKLEGLTHQEKLAFWINVYNSCMMKAFIEQGIPESPESIVALMHKATINIGGHLLNAITIEHFILHLPYHSKFTFSKGAKNNERTARSLFGLEFSEPLVTFALSCGSWSSPAVRVYTASQVENELKVAKREYLQAAVGISKRRKLTIPKLLDWYLLDFAKDFESLLDWICLQLPVELQKEAVKCLERGKDESISQCVQIMPYDYSFRYLIHI